MDISSNLKFKNLEAIEDPKNVNFISAVRVPSKKHLSGTALALEAGLVNNGKAVVITEPKGTFTFPFEPFFQLRSEMGRFYIANFAMLNENVCVNSMNFNGFNYVQDEQDKKFTGIVAKFKDGSEWRLLSIRNSAMATGEAKRLQKLEESIFNIQKNQEDLAKQRTKEAGLPDGEFAGVQIDSDVEEHEDYLSKIQAGAETFNAEMEDGATFDKGELHIESGGMETFE